MVVHSHSGEWEREIKPKQSAKALYQAQIEKKAHEIMNHVMQTSALENQSQAMIAKMPKLQVWA